jgi:class 3 adenylate cyclase
MRFLLFASLSLAVGSLPPIFIARLGGFWTAAALGALGLEVVAYASLQVLCVYRSGMSRYAWLAAALSSATLIFAAVVTGIPWGHIVRGLQVEESTLAMFAVGLGAFTLGILEGLVLTLVAIAGGYVKVWRRDKWTKSLSRQDAIRRVIELRARLSAATSESKAREGFRRIRTRFRQNAPSLSLGAGLAFGAGRVIAPGMQPLLAGLGSFGPAAIGLLAPGPGSAFLYATAFGLVELLLPWFRHPSLNEILYHVGPSALSRGLSALLVSIVSLLYERSSRDRRIGSNEREALVEELVLVEWRLQEAANWVTVLCIDAAGSTKMKVGADPLMVEFSFRAYQEWIARTSAEHQGVVQATAGDGAIVAFPEAAQALRAAKRLQSSIAEFNECENCIGVPFRVRIGIHRGQVRGALHEVEFTNVIDIAAHVEKFSPVGGVAITETAFEEVKLTAPDERAFALAEPIDGQKVYVVQNSTEGA